MRRLGTGRDRPAGPRPPPRTDDPRLRQFLVNTAAVLFALTFAMQAATDGNPASLSELSAFTDRWLGEQRVATRGNVKLSDLAHTNPNAN